MGVNHIVAVVFPFATGGNNQKIGNLDDQVLGVDIFKQVLDLSRGGSPVVSTTKLGHSLEGIASDCQSSAVSEPQTVLDAPFGPAAMTIQGLDALDAVIFETTFETFLGAGVNNPELIFDVAAAP